MPGLGQLYLQDGRWNDQQIISKEWVDYTRTPTPASKGEYGAHWWLAPDGLPEDTYYMGGNDGQYVFVIPSLNVVIVRLGVMRGPANYDNDLAPLLADVIKAIENMPKSGEP